MNLFPQIHTRAEKDDAVRRWAAMEGKSPSMCDDLIRLHARSPARRPISAIQVARVVELTALMLEAVRLLRTR